MTKKLVKIRIAHEIKSLYKRKQNLNHQLYELHMTNAKEWGNIWVILYNGIDQKLQTKMSIKYKIIINKIEKLQEQQQKPNTANPNNGKQAHTFAERTANLTNIEFTNEEMQLLNKGLKYNLHYKPKNWIFTIGIQAEEGVSYLPKKDQPYFRQTVANNLKKLINKHETQTKSHSLQKGQHSIREWKTMKSIKHKIDINSLIVTKADKGNTTVIIKKEEYNNKIEEFITQNQFTKLAQDITNTIQKRIRNYLNRSKYIINKHEKWKFINMNPRARKTHATVKLHKIDKPIRPIVNWKQCPAYELAKLLNKILNERLELPNAFNVPNSYTLAQELTNIETNEHIQLCCFDIANMYTNIPSKRPSGNNKRHPL
jgi:hypothetical protein